MSSSNPYRYVLPEIHRSRVSQTYYMPNGEPVTLPPDGPVSFPETCPACGAAKTEAKASRLTSARSYACGAAYTPKPQIQSHTEKWWGKCPVTKAEIEREGPSNG